MLKTLFSLVLISSLGATSIEIPQSQNLEEKNPTWKNSSVLSIAPYPQKKNKQISPVLEASAAVAVDFQSGKILYQKNAYEKLPIASITKLMTAIIISEEEDFSDIVTVSQNAANTPGSKIWLYAGETLRVEDLFAALLIPSANDAAVALAEHSAGSEEAFVKKMNEKAAKLGIKNTRFTNIMGFDAEKHYSTAKDISLLAMYAYKNPSIRKTVSASHMTITSTDGTTTHELESTNQILGGQLNIIGLKTGNTTSAGPSLAAVALGPDNHEVVTIILNSPRRFSETKLLLDWVYRSYTW